MKPLNLGERLNSLKNTLVQEFKHMVNDCYILAGPEKPWLLRKLRPYTKPPESEI